MRILLIVQPERFDFYNYLNTITNAEWYLLWYEMPGQMNVHPVDLPIQFQKIYYWTEFSTANNLLKHIKPDRIIFFEIIDLRQIALNVAASAKGIPTFYLEHGAAGDKETAILRWKEINLKNKLPYYFNRFIGSFSNIVKSKLFYFSVNKGFHNFRSYIKYFQLPFKMLKDSPNEVLANNVFPERVPAKSIVFNEVNFEEYALYTGIQKEQALFTGVPFFDKYFQPVIAIQDYVVYIDHPYLDEKLLGWSLTHFEKNAAAIFKFANERNILVYIKLHPRSNRTIWDKLSVGQTNVKIIQHGDYIELYLQATLILSYGSSLVTGFLCAKKNVVLLGWHPTPHIFGADFSQTGLCHVSFEPGDLIEKFDDWNNQNLTLVNEPAFLNFLHRFNYPFDGKATERVIKAIVADEIP